MDKTRKIKIHKGDFVDKARKFINKNKKPILIVGIVILAIIVSLVIYFGFANKNQSKKSEKISAITAEGVIKEETLNGLKFSNVVLIKKNKMYTMTMDVSNPTNNDVDIKMVDIVLKDKYDHEVVTLVGYIGKAMKPGDSRTITASVSKDLSKVVSKTISVSKS